MDIRLGFTGCSGYGNDYSDVPYRRVVYGFAGYDNTDNTDYLSAGIALGFDPIWFGVIIVLVTEMGVITPPVGINVYVIKGITKGISLETIFKGIIPFLIAIIICVALLLAFPKIATFLPGIASY